MRKYVRHCSWKKCFSIFREWIFGLNDVENSLDHKTEISVAEGWKLSLNYSIKWDTYDKKKVLERSKRKTYHWLIPGILKCRVTFFTCYSQFSCDLYLFEYIVMWYVLIMKNVMFVDPLNSKYIMSAINKLSSSKKKNRFWGGPVNMYIWLWVNPFLLTNPTFLNWKICYCLLIMLRIAVASKYLRLSLNMGH